MYFFLLVLMENKILQKKHYDHVHIKHHVPKPLFLYRKKIYLTVQKFFLKN